MDGQGYMISSAGLLVKMIKLRFRLEPQMTGGPVKLLYFGLSLRAKLPSSQSK